MNIFASFQDPERSARYLDDQRVVKMMTESVQMLCTTLHVVGQGSLDLHKPEQPNHPCTKWVREGIENFEWLYEHALALQDEWRLRWDHNKDHKSIAVFNRAKAYRRRKVLPPGCTPFVNCAANSTLGISFKHVKNTNLAYRLYLDARWKLQQQEYPRTRLPVCSLRGLNKVP